MKIKKRPHISRIWPDAPLQPIGTNFGLRVCLVDVIIAQSFIVNWLRGLDFVGSDFDHFHRNAMSPLTLLELTARASRYNIRFLELLEKSR